VTDFRTLLSRVADGERLTQEEAASAFAHMTSGSATPSQMGAFLMALRLRGETVEEISGAVETLRAQMLPVVAPPGAVDVVGTGGDASGSYNISTCAAFVVAGAGVPVAKHGNRALSSRCGAADVLAALGVRIGLAAPAVSRCIDEAGIGFMFAPAHHPALAHVAATRRELGTRTVFNLLGPMINPAGVRHHMIGVFAEGWLEPVARVLSELGSTRALVVHGSDGLDEVTLTGPTHVVELREGQVRRWSVDPAALGLACVRSEELLGGDADQNAQALRAVLAGRPGPHRDVVLLNAAAALLAADEVQTLEEGLRLASSSIDSGAAAARLSALVRVSHDAAAEHSSTPVSLGAR
jgi:anthranilate phosphoribosyltransferase